MSRYVELDRSGWDINALEANFEIYPYICPADKAYIRDGYEKSTGRDFFMDYELYTGTSIQDDDMEDELEQETHDGVLPPVTPYKLIGNLPPNGPARRGEEEWEPGFYYYSNDFGYNLGYPKPIDYYSDPNYVKYTDEEIAILMEAQMQRIESTAILSPRYAPPPRAIYYQPETALEQELGGAGEPQPGPSMDVSESTEHGSAMSVVSNEDLLRLDATLIALSESRVTQDPTRDILSAIALCEPLHLPTKLGTKRTRPETDDEDDASTPSERCVVKRSRNDSGEHLEFSLSGVDVKIYEHQVAVYTKTKSSVQYFSAGGKMVVVHSEDVEQATHVLRRFRRMYRSGLVDL